MVHTIFARYLIYSLLAACFVLICPMLSFAEQSEIDKSINEPLAADQELAEEETESSGGFLAVDDFLKAHNDFVSKAKRFTPLVELSTYYIPDATLEDSKARFDVFNYNLDALVPLPISEDTFLLAGGHAGGRQYEVNNGSGFDDERVYNMGLRFGVGHFVNPNLAIQGYWQPSIYSDLDGSLNADHWALWYGAGLAVYRTDDNFFWKGGLLISDAINTGVIPLFGFSWIFKPNWRLDILAPRLFEVSYLPTEEWDLHTGIRMDAEKYAISQDRPEGRFRRNIKIQDLRWYFGAIKKFDHGFSGFWRYGVAMRGKYDWGDEFVGRMEPSFFIRGGIGWNF